MRTAADLFHQGDLFFKFDYTSGYHHVEIFPEHTKVYRSSFWPLSGSLFLLRNPESPNKAMEESRHSYIYLFG